MFSCEFRKIACVICVYKPRNVSNTSINKEKQNMHIQCKLLKHIYSLISDSHRSTEAAARAMSFPSGCPAHPSSGTPRAGEISGQPLPLPSQLPTL